MEELQIAICEDDKEESGRLTSCSWIFIWAVSPRGNTFPPSQRSTATLYPVLPGSPTEIITRLFSDMGFSLCTGGCRFETADTVFSSSVYLRPD